ncbi:UNVERIFIED_CONTAM: hypothetical protein FKN15_050877 [Acipenser sinensis]
MALKLAVVCILFSLARADPVALKDHASLLADSTLSLGLNLYQTMVKDQNLRSENILFSPVVLASSLGVMTMGAKENTASQVKSVLNVDLQEDKLHPAFSALLSDVSDEKARNSTWKMGSRLYGPTSVNFRPQFVESSRKLYNHEHAKVNFRDKRRALQSINEWASQSTMGRVAEVTRELPGADGALFINAMYFKPHWEESFHDKMVDKRGFMTSRTHTVSVLMMHRTGYYKFYEDNDNRLYILEMQLAHKHSSMVFIMPFYVEPLERVEKMLTKEQLNRWFSKLENRAVALSLPKINLDVSHELQKHLQELGLAEAVDKTKADFSGMTGKKDLHVSNVLHAAVLEWDTEGKPFTQDIYGQPEFKSPKLFYADHPFIFLVRDNKTNSILLIGRLVKPKGENRDEL